MEKRRPTDGFALWQRSVVHWLKFPHTHLGSAEEKKKLIWVICQQNVFKQSKKLIGNLFSAPWAFTTSSTRAINLSSLSFRSMLIWVLGNSSNTCRWLAEKYFFWSQPHLLLRYETDLVKRGKTSALGSDIEINKIFAGCKVDAHLGGENKKQSISKHSRASLSHKRDHRLP